MNLVTSETDSKLTPGVTPWSAFVESISYATGEYALGHLLAARSTKGICAILMGDDQTEMGTDLATRFPRIRLVRNEAVVHDDLAKVTEFLDSPSKGLRLSLDMRGTAFQRLVWEKLRAIPVGKTVTYTELARWVGPLTSACAVAGACASNPIALAVPCHRVVGSNGDLTGYRWGIERKRELIRKEAMA
jgi:O-6-methylguanine DNA methyltransferase